MGTKELPVAKKLFDTGYFRAIDQHFADFICSLAGTADTMLYLAALTMSRYAGMGHICVDIAHLEEDNYPEEISDDEKIDYPDTASWIAFLTASSVVGRPGSFAPLILEKSRLYLQRYWNYEETVARELLQRAALEDAQIDHALLRKGLDQLFPPAGDEKDWQREAAHTAVTRLLSLITGGPGTGKTTTVIKILLLLLRQAQDQGRSCRIALCAPTGKAAAHLQKSLYSSLQQMSLREEEKQGIPVSGYTVHRLLKNIYGTPYFRHNKKNPLPYEVIVLDETSMIDMALFAKFLEAIPAHTRLIMLGDKDQLSSVEAGAILGDVCFPHKKNALQASIIHLQKSYRFGEGSGIGKLSRAVNKGDGAGACSLFTSHPAYPDIDWIDPDNLEQEGGSGRSVKRIIRTALFPVGGADHTAYDAYLAEDTLQEMFAAFKNVQVLTALRNSPFGVTSVNTIIEELLQERKAVKPGRRIYHGLPVLITENDYSLRLFNGDIGIALQERESKKLYVYFESNDTGATLQEESAFRKINPLQLKSWEPVYAMTVHKSQGSEFDTVFLLLPDTLSPVLTRELLYTGITRARKKIVIIGRKDIFMAACERNIQRVSGLPVKLTGAH